MTDDDTYELCNLDLTGGQIRNIAVAYGFLTAAEVAESTPAAFRRAARDEYRKAGRLWMDDGGSR